MRYKATLAIAAFATALALIGFYRAAGFVMLVLQGVLGVWFLGFLRDMFREVRRAE